MQNHDVDTQDETEEEIFPKNKFGLRKPSISSWNSSVEKSASIDGLSWRSSNRVFSSLQTIFKRKPSPHKEKKKKDPDLQSWRNLIIWQLGFLFFLTFFFSLGLFGYLSLVDPFQPRFYYGNRGLTTPGLSFRPHPVNPYSSLISFQHGGSGNWQTLFARFKEFLKGYSFGKRVGGSENCNFKTQLTKDFRCHVGNRKWMALDTDVPCTGAEKFGMYHGRPCMILKVNNVYGWEPEPYYNLTEVANHPTMPGWLKEYIDGYWNKKCKGKGEEYENRCPEMRMIWLSCEGETAADTENMGKVYYVPWQGFPGFYYPYMNQQHYLSPLIFIQFRSITPGVIIQVRCKIWAKNIEHDERNARKGGVHFEIMMD